MSSICFALSDGRGMQVRLLLKRAPNKSANHQRDYQYDRQRESGVAAACLASHLHVTQDVSPKMRRRADRKKPARRSADGTSALAFRAQRKIKMHVPYSF